MKAITYQAYGTPEVLKLEEVQMPTPGKKEVRIRIHATAVSSTDTIARKGNPYIARLGFGLFRPKQHILGTEFAGEIEEVGSSVTRFKKGDQIYAATGVELGAYAEYICLPEEGAIALKPANASYEEAAAIAESCLTALPFLRDEAKLRAGQKILIIGASGAIGTAAIQLAKYFGAEVTGVCSTRNLAMVKSLGADHVIDYKKEDFSKSDQSWDVIFDTVGKSSFPQAKKALKPNGLYLSTFLNFSILWNMLKTSIAGSKKAKIAFTGLRSGPEKTNDLRFLRGLIENGQLKPFIDRQYPLKRIAEAHRYIETGHKRGNVVLTLV
jgi:NADPH:quinone reductase-like Zn-dependent oxidoreductase